ncbi:MAG TPA: hypothetical protein VLA71_21785, partial [Algoriphagus sp.]|nr:hypothetical protein [Algoriphagus sp.]
MNIFQFSTLVLFFFLFGNLNAQSTLSQAPEGFDQLKPEIAKGKIDTLTYYSTTVGTERKTLVYTPPGFSESKKYPVLYLL